MAFHTAGSSIGLPKDSSSLTSDMASTPTATTSNTCPDPHPPLPAVSDLPTIYSHPRDPPPLPSYQEPHPGSRQTLLTLPPEIVRQILYFCSAPRPNLPRGGELNHPQLQCNLPFLRTTAKSISSTCKALRIFLLDLGCCGESLRIPSVEGIRHWALTPPIWQNSRDISLRWDDTGLFTWAWGVEEAQWEIIKTQSDALYGVREPETEVQAPKPLRADQINMTGEKPKDLKAYAEACRAYLRHPSPPAPSAKRHRAGLAQDLYALLSGCKRLHTLNMDFPGAMDAFTKAVMELPEDASVLDTVGVLELRNGNEMLFPPPQRLFVAISRLRALQEVRVTTNCGNRNTLFSIKERKRRGIYFEGGQEGVCEKAEVLSGLWGWACERLEPAKMPMGLKKCMVYSMPGLAPREWLVDGRSTGVWTWYNWPMNVGTWGVGYDMING